MSCMIGHKWAWPRRRGAKDIQVCVACGFERVATIQFGNQPVSQTFRPADRAVTDGCVRRGFASRWFRLPA